MHNSAIAIQDTKMELSWARPKTGLGGKDHPVASPTFATTASIAAVCVKKPSRSASPLARAVKATNKANEVTFRCVSCA